MISTLSCKNHTRTKQKSAAKAAAHYIKKHAIGDQWKPLYVTLGQPTCILSGGGTQRLNLASELHKSGNIYVPDEPSSGLHRRNVERLLALLRCLVEQGDTAAVVEPRLELIAADWVIDLGQGEAAREER